MALFPKMHIYDQGIIHYMYTKFDEANMYSIIVL